jgi:hypothetical protein
VAAELPGIIEANTASVLLDDFGYRPGAQCVGQGVATTIDGWKQRPFCDCRRLEPRHWQATIWPLLVGLLAADRHSQASIGGLKIATVSAAISERRDAPAMEWAVAGAPSVAGSARSCRR